MQWLKGWNVMRVLRLLMAVLIIFQGIDAKQWFIVVAGVIFAILPILNVGCCGTTGCNTSHKNKKDWEEKPTTYTEIK